MTEKKVFLWMKISSNKWLSFLLLWLFFFGLALVLRLPHLLSRVSFFDGDEAIIGLMAKDLLAGRNFPLYFYGQNYGFSFFEVLTTAFWIKILGPGIWALRLGGLSLFSLGSVFLFKGFLHRNIAWKIALVACTGVLAFPSWFLWGMMVRGGYVTSFLAVCFMFYLLGKQKFSLVNLMLLGIALAVAFEAQSLILLPVLPLLLRDWFKNKGTWKNLLLGIGFAIVSVLLLNFLDQNIPTWGSPGMSFEMDQFSERYLAYWQGIQHAFTNFFFFHINFDAPSWWWYLSILAMILLPVAFVLLFWKSDKKDKIYLTLWLFAVIFLFLILGVFIGYSPRYLIAFFSGFLFLFTFYLHEVVSIKLLKFSLLLFFMISLGGIGAGSKMIRDFYDLKLNYMQSLEQLHEGIVKEKKQAVFACDNFLNWHWNYLYGDEIPSIAFRNEDRISRFANQVDSLYQFAPNKTAIIGFEGAPLDMHKIYGYSETDYKIGTRYFIQPDVKPAYHDLGYEKMGKAYEALKFNRK